MKPEIRQAQSVQILQVPAVWSRKLGFILRTKMQLFSRFPVLSIPPLPVGACGGDANTLKIILSGFAQVPGQLTCFHPRHLSSQLLARRVSPWGTPTAFIWLQTASVIACSPQAFDETVTNPCGKLPPPLQSALTGGTDFAHSLAQPLPVHGHLQSPDIRPIGTCNTEVF